MTEPRDGPDPESTDGCVEPPDRQTQSSIRRIAFRADGAAPSPKAPVSAGADRRLGEARDESGERSAPVPAPAEARPAGPAPGQVLAGEYELVAPLSEGGMGSVWVAHSPSFRDDVAIKLLRPEVPQEIGAERFLAEARALACVHHPSIVRLLDYGTTGAGTPFLVMELLDGLSLAEHLASHGALSPVEAVRLILPVAAALATAHARGILHRDVKPDNVVLVPRAQNVVPKLIDFGIAKPSRPTGRRLTHAGALLGSPDYMAPEQVRGSDHLDERVDVWGLAMTIYEAIHGVPAFTRATPTATLQAIVDGAPLQATPLFEADPDLFGILGCGLAKPLEGRFRTARALGRALARWAATRGIKTDLAGSSIAAHWLLPA
jgi:serine/threonine-protein kinase